MAITVVDMDIVDYKRALNLQRRTVERIQKEAGHETLFLLEHYPVITLGRNSDGSSLITDSSVLKERGVEVFETDRGGDVTFHGPGQLVGYPIILLRNGERDISRYVRNLEETLIRTLAFFSITGYHHEKYRGVWVEDRKIASIGVRISRWTTSHGFALNVTTDLSYFSMITPCGLEGCRITSMKTELGFAPQMKMVKKKFVENFSEVLARKIQYEKAPQRKIGNHAP